ncbi:unnamed protein product [Microthlaspi erraticum]|uniref:Aspartic peptidase DDI1-type domain-containing protein n=1 Tax=Microthlaspi erraticum TaxID=1685480 RepID=A0A6D2HTH1_9BRAS|nr:unnamed protein product [Microthlaspi erraticum]
MSTHQINLLTSPTFLPKVKDQGKFTLPCTLGHIELDNALVDSGASINLATSKSFVGVFKNYHLKIGECIIQTDSLSWKWKKRRIYLCYWEPHSLAQVERPRSDRPRADRLVQAPLCLDEESLQALFDEPLGSAQKEGEDAASKALVGEKRKNPPAQVSSAKPSQLTMTLFPTKFENGKIEYKIRYKGRSRPFSRAKALVTSEQSRDPTKLKELLSQVLTITLDGILSLGDKKPARPQLDRARNKGNSIEFHNSTEEVSSYCSRTSVIQARLREERTTKKRKYPISSESEEGEFEIGVNIGREESDESESEEGEEVNQEIDESNQDEPTEEAEPQEVEDELPMFEEHYNALSLWTLWKPSTHMTKHEGTWDLQGCGVRA